MRLSGGSSSKPYLPKQKQRRCGRIQAACSQVSFIAPPDQQSELLRIRPQKHCWRSRGRREIQFKGACRRGSSHSHHANTAAQGHVSQPCDIKEEQEGGANTINCTHEHSHAD
ncbi:hypothetical protein FQA47_023095 [Oryzias melastigma]|uniref:Uncharacterized protein n=1 Tax=Oryzias melastigma TaxID=30732 RepID=A0A834FCR3_ORYME|nr:hypothetical protein FQA47_023095 [Oryzias melastigma]